ncbi:hypoxia-inducible factor 1-alpha-like [Arapaima gigas]
MDAEIVPGKKSRVSSERRKEKSRDAARCRRGMESEVFYELAHQLPLPHSISSNLDKASIMRLTIGYLHIRKLLSAFEAEEESELDSQLNSFHLKALEGFLMVLSVDGDMVYLSENVNNYVGLTQFDLIGHSIFDFLHPCDHEEMRDVLIHNIDTPKKAMEQNIEQSFFLRMKCTLTSRGRTVNIKSATWKVLHCTRHIHKMDSRDQEGHCDDKQLPDPYLLLICEPIPHPSNIEFPLDSKTFLSRHNLDMKFSYCDERITELMGYNPEDLLNQSVYEYYHVLDSDQLRKMHHNLFTKGQVTTGKYRMLAKRGGFAWIETQATVIYNTKNSQPQCVVCVNYVLSGIVEKDLVLSMQQIENDLKEKESESSEEDTLKHFISYDEGDSNDSLYEKLKSEPEHLTQLAPAAGDAIIHLDFTIPASDIADLKEVPVYNDVMLPSSSEKFSLSPLDPNKMGQPLSGRLDATITEEVMARLEPTTQDFSLSVPCSSVVPYFLLSDPHSGNSSSKVCTNKNTSSTLCSLLTFSKQFLCCLQPSSPMDCCFQVESDIDTEFKLDLVEKLFAFDTQDKTPFGTEAMEDLDLEMLAPYIPMDDDFQLRILPPTEPLPSTPKGVSALFQGLPGSMSSSAVVKQELVPQPSSPLLLPEIHNTPGSPSSGDDSQVSSSTAVPLELAENLQELSSKLLAPHNFQRKRKRIECPTTQAVGLVLVQPVESGKRPTGLESAKSEPFLTHKTVLLLPSDLVSRLLGCGLPELTQYDCEVNAPILHRQHLLQGEELLRALDQVS